MCKTTTKGFDAQLCAKINGIRTEFVLQRFVNKWFLLITQYEKMCNIFSVQFDQKQGDCSVPVPPPNYDDPSVPITITNTFGTDTDEARSAIQFLVNKSNLGKCPTELIISIGLKEINGKVLREISSVLNEIIVSK
ncbi:uncharacterized protein LOC129907580 [Episyrphus balteatus]|uniref:uncharacterized protein LOC129907580 n=1 Tax=Episyrphus balteatus TaxID=286459 RepID=UPI002486A0C3|nr:uncharacterized protein LOC129907580 [Episyrphus balteatus]